MKHVLMLLSAGASESSEGKALVGQTGCGKSAAAHRQASMDNLRVMPEHDFEVVLLQWRDQIAEGFAK